MMRKTTIVNGIFLVAVCYIISPYFFTKYLFFNEVLSLTGFLLLIYKRFRMGSDTISILMLFLLMLGGIHAITSLFRMDTLYYYLRNMVIFYSMMAFFIGYYLLGYLPQFIASIRRGLQYFIGGLAAIPLPRIIFERFGVATLFPALFRDPLNRWVPYLLIIINIIYAIAHDSATGIMLTALYILLFISPGFRFFGLIMLSGLVLFTIVFIYLQPNLDLISRYYSFRNDDGIIFVRRSHPWLSIDANSTWRLVLWKEIIVDNFPGNMWGMGFGTPVLKYYPIEVYEKLPTLPYVLGAHNSFVYLFGRLGILYVFIHAAIYYLLFREYFHHKLYYYKTKEILLFWSFFALTMIVLFNPGLETPIYASGYWLVLGFIARAIQNRQLKTAILEDTVRA